MEAPLREHIIETYRKRAGNYDFTANLYYLLGYREWAYRRKAVEALKLESGDTVVELACGTGLNFPLYQEAVGPKGKIIGVDLTDAMLVQARRRVAANGWENVELVHSDALEFQFPAGVEAVISTYALSLIPGNQRVLENSVEALAPGGRLGLLELKIPDNWPQWLISLAVWLVSPFGATEEWLARRPWESIQRAMRVLLTKVSVSEMYLGTTYVIVGEKR